MANPIFITDKASCIVYIEEVERVSDEFKNIEDMQYGSAMVKADTEAREKCLVITEKAIEELTTEYQSKLPYRLDALLEATDHKLIPDNLSEAEELMKLASIYRFLTNRPTFIIVKEQALYDELMALRLLEDTEPLITIIKLSAARSTLCDYQHFDPRH